MIRSLAVAGVVCMLATGAVSQNIAGDGTSFRILDRGTGGAVGHTIFFEANLRPGTSDLNLRVSIPDFDLSVRREVPFGGGRVILARGDTVYVDGNVNYDSRAEVARFSGTLTLPGIGQVELSAAPVVTFVVPD
ncbi:MAG: hypothetical protein AAF683_04080 [Pseudomonadota bacterium]